MPLLSFDNHFYSLKMLMSQRNCSRGGLLALYCEIEVYYDSKMQFNWRGAKMVPSSSDTRNNQSITSTGTSWAPGIKQSRWRLNEQKEEKQERRELVTVACHVLLSMLTLLASKLYGPIPRVTIKMTIEMTIEMIEMSIEMSSNSIELDRNIEIVIEMAGAQSKLIEIAKMIEIAK